jgi:hypothetical protein
VYISGQKVRRPDTRRIKSVTPGTVSGPKSSLCWYLRWNYAGNLPLVKGNVVDEMPVRIAAKIRLGELGRHREIMRFEIAEISESIDRLA